MKIGDKVYIFREATESEIQILKANGFHWVSHGVHKYGIVDSVGEQSCGIIFTYVVWWYPNEYIRTLRSEKLERLLDED